jgi:ankyrin repeat protein
LGARAASARLFDKEASGVSRVEKWSEEDEQLRNAALFCGREAIKTWLSKGGRPGVLVEGETPLIVATRQGDSAALGLMLAACSKRDLEARDEAGFTALMHASQLDSVFCAWALLRAGADLEALSPGGHGSVFFAARVGNEMVLEALLGAGARADAPEGARDSALAAAAQAGSWACVEMLIAAGSGVDDAGSSGTTALMAAAMFRDAGWASRLLVLGADPLASDAKGVSVREKAAEMGSPEVAALLAAAAASRMEQSQLAEACEVPPGPGERPASPDVGAIPRRAKRVAL